MAFHPFDVSVAHITYAALGGFVVLFGMFSLFIREKLYIGEAIWAFLFGVVIGPYGGNLFNPRAWANGHEDVGDQITLEVTRVVLAIGVFAIGVELPKQYMKRHWKSLFFLLAPVMTWGWFVSAGLIFALVPALSFLSSLAVAACLTPTDPILAAAVVGGKYADKHVPAHLRHLLAAESGCNDGAAFPFLFIALYLVIDSTPGHAVEDWFLITWLYEVVLGVVIGVAVGIGFRHLMRFCERNNLIDRQSYVAQYISLALFTVGVTTLLGSDDLLAAFASGTAFAWDGFFNKQTEQSVFSSVIDLLFNVAAFVYIGAWMPFSEFHSDVLTLTVWRLLVIAVLTLLLRRLPAVVALYKFIPDIKTFREAVFSGHFGPMGVGAIFISTLAKERLPTPRNPPQDQVELLAASIQPIVAFMVLCSIVIHGMSIPFFSLGRRVHSVSRTWSRHQSMDPAVPEWVTQTRHVSNANQIVINRDEALERGESQSKEKADAFLLSEKEKPLPSSSSTLPSRETPEEEPGAKHHQLRPHTEATTPDGKTPDDDDDKKTTWPEGRDLVVEHEKPGEEVDVTVIRDAFRKAEVPHDNALTEKLAAILRGEASDTPLMKASPSSTAQGAGVLLDFVSDDEWQDVEETNDQGPSRRRSPSLSRLKNSQLASTKEVQRLPKHRRNSFRHSIFSKDIRLSPSLSEPSAGGSTSAPQLVQSHSESSVRGRLGAVIAEEATRRQHSPTRSVRWDNVPAGHDHSAPTPRNGRTPLHSPLHSPPLSRTTTPEPDGPRVQFELPSAPTRP